MTKAQKDSNPNMRIWDRVCVTDPKAVKPITGKDYGGNSPKPYWIVQRLTEEFGPCGAGWGYVIESERFERFSDTDTLHIAKVKLWYVMPDTQIRGEVEQMGQTKATYMTSKGVFKVDEDAPKKSVTDALVKCASYLGFAGDIFSGRWDDSKYVAWAREQYEEPKAPSPIPENFRSSATMGEMEALTPEQQEYIRDLAMEILALVKDGWDTKAVHRIEQENLDDTQKMSLWSILDSKTRRAIKDAQKALREAVPA